VIRIGSTLTLPPDVVTQTVGIVAMKRAGKSYFARRFAEQLYHAGQQIVVVDPKGDWWGIKSSADGRGPGLPIVALGGERGDVPLEPGSGELVAQLVVEDRVSALLDLSDLRKHEVATFMAAFLETLYRLKNHERYRTPVMLFIDEADQIAPQASGRQGMKGGSTERMLGAANDIVRRGGQRGIGCTLITQRTAVLSKDVLTQVQVLVALRTIAELDLKAMRGWTETHGTEADRVRMMTTLPSLPVGRAWVWSPGWPTADGIFQHVQTLPIETYDSGRTPEVGVTRDEPAARADVDLGAFRKKMAAAIDRKKETDPKLLKAEVAELRKALAAAREVPPSMARVSEARVLKLEDELRETTKDVRAVKAEAEGLVDDARVAIGRVREVLVEQQKQLSLAIAAIDHANLGEGRREKEVAPLPAKLPPVVYPSLRFDGGKKSKSNGKPAAAPAQTPSDELRAGERQMLIVLARQGATWRSSSTISRAELSLLTGIAPTGGTFRQYLRHLIALEYVLEYDEKLDRRSGLVITSRGLARVDVAAPRPFTRDEVVELWQGRLRAGERTILHAVLEHPSGITRADLARHTGFEITGGTFRQYIAHLARNGLVDAARRSHVVRPSQAVPAS
jgi:hypothetical protein